MISHAAGTLPGPHRQFLDRAVERLAADPRIVGVAVAGSYLDDTMDEYSDVDLVVAVEPANYTEVIQERKQIAASLGSLLVAFTGEHVGEPRLLICLYDSPLLHVDLKFVSVADMGGRVDDPAVLWERDGRLTAVLPSGVGKYPPPDPQWIEDRFWVWMHFMGAKIGRGEWFEAMESLSFLRSKVLGPLGLRAQGLRPTGVRRIELIAPSLADELKQTIATHDAHSLLAATRGCIALYRRLRAAEPTSLQLHSAAEAAAVAYLRDIEARQ